MAVRRRCDSCRVQIRRGRLLGGWVHAGRRRCCGAAARLGQHFVVRRTALFAGRAVHRPARVSSASPSHAHPAAVCAANGWRRPSDEQTQRCVVSTFVRPLGQRVRMNGAEHGPSAGVDHGHNDLGSARRGEHDPVARGPAGGDVHSFASVCGVHRHTILGPTLASRRWRATANRSAGTPRRSSVRILAIDDRGVVVAVLMLLPLRAGPALRRAAGPATRRRRRCRCFASKRRDILPMMARPAGRRARPATLLLGARISRATGLQVRTSRQA